MCISTFLNNLSLDILMLLLSEFKLLKNIYASKKDLNLGDVKQTYVSRVGKKFT